MEKFKKLTREEMKKVLGGVEPPPSCGQSCTAPQDCSSGCPSCLTIQGSRQCSSVQ